MPPRKLIWGVYTEDERGNFSLATLYEDEDDANQEAERLSPVNAVVLDVWVIPKQVSFQSAFRQGTGRSE